MTRGFGVAVLLVGWLMLSANAQAGMKGFFVNITIDVEVHDEAGKPIPYVTLWGGRSPYSSDNPFSDLKSDDLLRTAARYGSLPHRVTYFYRPTPGSHVFPMADSGGQSEIVLDYTSGPPRPSEVTINLAFIKAGYVTEFRSLVAGTMQNRFELDVVLKRDPAQRAQKDYEAEFDRIRYELSDIKKNAQIKPENQKRLEELRAQLERVAETAVAEKNNDLAAVAYEYISRMPEITIKESADGTRMTGFDQTGVNSARNKAAFNRALDLAETEPNLLLEKMMRDYERKGVPMHSPLKTDADKAGYRQYVKQLEPFVNEHAERLWPDNVGRPIYANIHIGEYEKACAALERLSKFEPRYDDYEKSLKNLNSEFSYRRSPYRCELHFDLLKAK